MNKLDRDLVVGDDADEFANSRAEWLAENVLPHETALRKWLGHKALGEIDIDDVVQETYAILAEREHVDDIRNPRNYAFQVAYSVIQAHVRRSRIVAFRSVHEMEEVELASDMPSPEREALDREFLKSVASYLDSLPKSWREAVVLRHTRELSYRDIASRLGISEKAVERVLYKAGKRLVDAFGRGDEGGRQSSSVAEGRKPRAG